MIRLDLSFEAGNQCLGSVMVPSEGDNTKLVQRRRRRSLARACSRPRQAHHSDALRTWQT